MGYWLLGARKRVQQCRDVSSQDKDRRGRKGGEILLVLAWLHLNGHDYSSLSRLEFQLEFHISHRCLTFSRSTPYVLSVHKLLTMHLKYVAFVPLSIPLEFEMQL